MGTNKQQIFGRKPKPRKGNGPLSAPTAPADVPAAGAATSPKGWQRERVQRLARICRCLERGRSKGKRLHELVVWFAWRWKGRRYKSDPARPIRFGYSTLLRHWYRWKAAEGNASALVLRFQPPKRRLCEPTIQKLIKQCLQPGVTSYRVAYQRLSRPAGNYHAYYYALGPQRRALLGKLFAARRKVDFYERRAKRLSAQTLPNGETKLANRCQFEPESKGIR